MSVQTCVGCSTPYAKGLDACPHCGGTDYVEEGHTVTRRMPLFVSVACSVCGRGPWQLRLPVRLPGLVELPSLFCASCGSQVQVPWPPVEEDMPKITRHGGPTNARGSVAPSPDAPASLPPVVAEDGRGPLTSDPQYTSGLREAIPAEPLPEVPAEAGGEDAVDPGAVPAPDYDGMTLAELRDEAGRRDVPSYGTKAQIAERLRAADEE